MRSPYSFIAVTVAALTLVACPRQSGGQVRDDSDEAKPQYTAHQDDLADAALAAATQVQQTQTPQKAIEAFLAVRRDHPRTTAAQESLYRAGVLYFETADFANARKTLNELLFENPLFHNALDVKLKLGLASVEVHAYRDAYQLLMSIQDDLSGADKQRATEAAARAAEGAQLFDDALALALKRFDDAQSTEEKQVALSRLTELVEGKVGFLDVAKARQNLSTNHAAWPILTFKLARIYYHLRDWPRLEETLKAFLREAPGHAFAAQAEELLARAKRRADSKQKTVGVVLPMTGKYKEWGEAVMRGVQVALHGSDIELIVKDSQADVNLAGKMVEELAFDDGAIAIIGPLLSDDSRRAAIVAEELEIPILTLTKSEDITAIGPYVFRNMLTNSQQADALADYAMNTLGYKNFAMLYPNLQFGVELTNDFWDKVAARGGTVRGAESYDHDQTTYTNEVKKLVGRYYLDDRSDYLEKYREVMGGEGDAFRKRKALDKVKSSLEPVVDFDALLIPDSWKRVSLIAPALAVEDIITNACDPKDLEKIRKTTGKKQIKTVTLLGTSSWSSPKGRTGVPELVERGGKFVMCSVFVDGFFADSNRPGTKRFMKAYVRDHKDAQPTLLDATGYDAAGMLRNVIERGNPKTRAELASQLAALKDFDGASGKTSFNDQREAVKPLFFLTVDKEGIKEVTPGKKPSGS